MRKSLVIVSLLIMVFAMSIGVAAENSDDQVFSAEEFKEEYDFNENYYSHFADDGVAWESKTGEEYVNINGINRRRYTKDADNMSDVEKVAVTLNAEAYIPSYLELTVTGNEGKIEGKSFGPGAQTARETEAGKLIFDNEIGGFVNEDWKLLGAGRNAEIEPGADVYLQACDLYKVEAYGNTNYRYEIKAQSLVATNNGDNKLPLEMRSSLDKGDSWRKNIKFSDQKIEVISKEDATDSLTTFHQFRVPYSRDVVHGKYEGKVTFRVVSL